jgi:3-deoxy-manno-octulosonate cytidylyltransferase (CMP-KDO synthetase)
MVQWVYEAALKVNKVNKVIVATDSEEVFDTVVQFGGEATMTSKEHLSGTDRIGEVAQKMPEYDVFINMQGDEPLIEPKTIQKLVDYYSEGGNSISTLYERISDENQLFDYNVVKLVFTNVGKILYFSRSAIPAQRDVAFKNWMKNSSYWRHIGLYGFKRDTLMQICQLKQSSLEQLEVLEQLRWLENGYDIHAIECQNHGVGVDTKDDLERAEMRILGL